MFNPDHLVTLEAVVEEGTVQAAADRLGVTPSAVSQQLARLSKQVGRPVMARRGRALTVTDSALILVDLAKRYRDLDERARGSLELLTSEVAGSLTLSGFPTAITGLLAPATATMGEQYRDIVLSVLEMTPEQSAEAVLQGAVDVAVVHDWTDRHLPVGSGVQVWDLGLDPVDLIAREDEALHLFHGAVDLDDLDDRVWIDDSPGVFSDWLLEALASRGLNYRIGSRTDDFSGKVALVAAGFGICLLPRLGRDRLPAPLAAFPLLEAPTRRVRVLHRQASTSRPAVRAILRTLQQTWHQHTELPDLPAQPPPPSVTGRGPRPPRPGAH